MNIFAEVVVPGVIILIANVFSHGYGSSRYETVTAIFGWIAAFAFTVSLFTLIIHTNTGLLLTIKNYAIQIFALSLVIAISRDCEKILKPNESFFEEKIK